MRRKISAKTWEQVKVAHASGIGLREIARNMGIPEGTVLARASREHWTPRIEPAKSLAKPVETEIVPACDAAAQTMQERGVRHVERMARVTDKVLPHLKSMEPGEISTARATWSDSITWHGVITGWSVNHLRAARLMSIS